MERLINFIVAALFVIVSAALVLYIMFFAPLDTAQAADRGRVNITSSCKADGDIVVKVTTTRPTWVNFFGIDTDEDAHVKVDGSVSFRSSARLYNVTYQGQDVFPRDPYRNMC